ncbi:uncharacterized protein LOC131218613 isoform X2 [Magnolia sinica]|uniref:uncharacterized protein LOC131218613 isoform X2 n=1 Tax=Magnolia sinica TaxID=86752 RepID=UPI0026592356|nr:uncharacterized protein LOC131218613 isoform X2 [Magnolia sinica]
MVTLRKRVRSEEIHSNPKRAEEKNPSKKPAKRNEETIPSYEQSRDERIKENLLRMQKLGIIDLSQKLKCDIGSAKRPPKKIQIRKSSPPISAPPRRSSRLQSITPVSYTEVRPNQAEKSSWNGEISLKEGPLPEIYTEEHDKLLGNCKLSWELFEDGYGADGKRMYDPVNGKTCHQCRYGENVLEVNMNPNWVCPVCRGICNCSLCRLKRGWAPTGPLYKKVLSLGFKSVAHYLIQTRRSTANAEDPVPKHPSSAKRSLAFADAEDMNVESNDWDKELNSSDHHGSNQKIENKQAGRQTGLETVDNVGSGSELNIKIKHKARKPSLISPKLKNKHRSAKKSPGTPQRSLDSSGDFASESVPEPTVAPESILGCVSDVGSAFGSMVRIKRIARKSHMKPTAVLLLSSDGVVHFSLESEPKPTAVPQLSSDGVLHFQLESELKPTAVPQLSSDGVLHFQLEGKLKPTAVPQLSSDDVLHFQWESEPKPTAAPELSSDVACNVVSGSKPKAGVQHKARKASVAPSPDCIARRLRKRHNMS